MVLESSLALINKKNFLLNKNILKTNSNFSPKSIIIIHACNTPYLIYYKTAFLRLFQLSGLVSFKLRFFLFPLFNSLQLQYVNNSRAHY